MLQLCGCMHLSGFGKTVNEHLVTDETERILWSMCEQLHVSMPCGGGTSVQTEMLFVTICLKQSCYELLLRLLRLASPELLLLSTLCVVVCFSSVHCVTSTGASLHYTHLLSLSLIPAFTCARV